MKLPLAVLADYANVTAEGKLNIMGIFDQVFTLQMPAVLPPMRLILRFVADPADRGATKALEIRLLDADDNEVLSLSSSFGVPADAPLAAKFQHVLELSGITVERFGLYAFHILVNGETRAEVPFSIDPLPTVVPE